MRSQRWPPTGLVPRYILQFTNRLISTCKDFLRRQHACFPPSNLSSDVQEALDQLLTTPDITLMKADKGGKWTLMKTTDYDAEALRQLRDTTFYQPSLNDSSVFLRQRIRALLISMHKQKFISKKELNFLLPHSGPDVRKFYHLPKLHKDDWPSLVSPPGRPIVSDVRSVSYASSKILEFFLSPLVQKQNSYLRDTGHVISILMNTPLQRDDILFTMDIEALYTNVPLDEGLDIIAQLFRDYPDPLRPDLSLLTLLKLLLMHNDFYFKDSRWTQTRGVAMGKIFSGSFASLFLGVWESKCIASSPTCPVLWKRFQDDVFGVWRGPLPTLQQFHTLVNAQHPNMKCSLTYGSSVNFLDLTVCNVAGSFVYKLFTKPTDSHLLLPPSSYHPSHTFTSVLFSQILRISSRSSERRFFIEALATKSRVWRQQGFSRSSIRRAKNNVLELTQQIHNWGTGTFKCNPPCHTCPFLQPSLSVQDYRTNNLYPIQSRITCSTTHVIYVVTCPHNHVYVGQTERSLKERIQQHLSSSRHQASTPFHKHLQECPDMRFFGVERVLNQHKRTNREHIWITRLHATLNTQQNNADNNKITCVLPFSKCAANLTNVLRSQCDEIALPVRIAFRKNMNLNDIFTRRVRDATACDCDL